MIRIRAVEREREEKVELWQAVDQKIGQAIGHGLCVLWWASLMQQAVWGFWEQQKVHGLAAATLQSGFDSIEAGLSSTFAHCQSSYRLSSSQLHQPGHSGV